MKAVRVTLIIFICYIAKSSSENLQKSSNRRNIPVVDALLTRLEVEDWADDEACRLASLRILHGVRNNTLWATWIWDSMQPPLGIFYGSGLNLGNYDQCLNTPGSSQHEVSTQYCLVIVKIQDPMKHRALYPYDSSDEYLNTLSTYGRALNHIIGSVCMPAICSTSAVARFYRNVLELTHIPDAELVDPQDCQTAERKPYSKETLTFLFIFGLLSGIAVISTAYMYVYNNKGNSKIDDIAKAFCVINNWNNLFKVNNNDLRAINGMRFMTAIVIIGVHCIFLRIHKPSFLIDSLKTDEFMDTGIGKTLLRLDLLVDTFFSISGLLFARNLLSGKQMNLLIVLAKRYFRLIGPYIATTFYIMHVAQHTGSGPIWPMANAEEEGVCEKNWWKNVLMMHYDVKTMCFGLAWYVSCDYHLSILTVVMFWIYRKNRKGGIITFFSVICVLTVQLAVKAYKNGITLVTFKNIMVVENFREYELFNMVYIRWHDRAGSYFIGIVMGWIITKYKPSEYRNVFSKTTSFIISMLGILAIVSTASIGIWFSDTSGALEAIAVATNRSVWAAGVCALIAACEYGSVPIINDFLSCALFVPLSKLSYGIYMVHYLILQRVMHTTRTPMNFDLFGIVITTTGTGVFAIVVSLILHILVEAPCVHISNIFLSDRLKETEVNSSKQSKGIHSNGKAKLN